MVNGLLGGVEQVNAGACQQDFFQGGLCGLLRVWGLRGDFVVEVWVWE